MGINCILITSKDATAETPIFLQLCLHNARFIRVEPHHMQAEEAGPAPWTQCPRSQLAARPCLSIILANISVVALCLLGALLVVREVFVVFEAFEHALSMPWELFITLCGRILAASGRSTIFAIVRTVIFDPRRQRLLTWRRNVRARRALSKLFARPTCPTSWILEIQTWCAAGATPSVTVILSKTRVCGVFATSHVCTTLV
mmetsp:Transcript_78872/g.152315  ORF Transcript_78872/g.152315 Transcript_78872/m.152315 type:complete len:202 (+) Transcript_78872:985-1590(+)